MSKIADLHCHPNLKPNRYIPQKDIWQKIYTPELSKVYNKVSIRKLIFKWQLQEMSAQTQSNLDDCMVGQNTLVFTSLYPIERPFITLDRPFKRLFVGRLLLDLFFGLNENNRTIELDAKLIMIVTGFDKEWVKRVLKDTIESTKIDYYHWYSKEYDFLIQSQGLNNQGNVEFQLVNNLEELENREQDPQPSIQGIVNIEGIHSLGHYNKKELWHRGLIDSLSASRQKALKDVFVKNISKEKNKEFPPFYITFCHHFNNLLAGHSKTLANALFYLFDQRPGLNLGFSKIGLELVDLLLDRSQGKRILIDTKHMSVQSRIDFYAHLDKNYPVGDDLSDPYFHIPIICSHAAVNAHQNIAEAKNHKDRNKGEKKSYVSRFQVNLNDEDIRQIYKRDGLIGVCMHEGRMPGKVYNKRLKKFEKKKWKREVKRLSVQLFLTNVFHIVKVNQMYLGNSSTNKQLAWKTVCLGTDNDGIVNPFNEYRTAASLHAFKQDCINFLDTYTSTNSKVSGIPNLHRNKNGRRKFTEMEIKSLLAGYSPSQAMDLVFYTNVKTFLNKYFNQEYLEGSRVFDDPV
jgi:microsomal dipeptidase-like Zn-dependent dipeptidase